MRSEEERRAIEEYRRKRDTAEAQMRRCKPGSLEEYAAGLDVQQISYDEMRRLERAAATETFQARLRDEFAMAALTGPLAETARAARWDELPGVAEDCYRIADAMLAAREKPEAPK